MKRLVRRQIFPYFAAKVEPVELPEGRDSGDLGTTYWQGRDEADGQETQACPWTL